MDRLKALPTWAKWALGIFALLIVIGALSGGEDENGDQPASATTPVVSTSPSEVPTNDTGASTGTGTTETTTTPTQTIQDAQEEIDDDDYAAALAIAAVLTAAEANAIRRRISNRIARRVQFALRNDDSSRARRLLRQADKHPTTALIREARADYRVAKERAAERARKRRLAAERRRQQRAAERAAARARRQQQQQQENTAPSVPSGTCSEIPQTDFPVPPGDPRDRDGDGIACES